MAMLALTHVHLGDGMESTQLILPALSLLVVILALGLAGVLVERRAPRLAVGRRPRGALPQPRAPAADGLSITYNSHSSARKGRCIHNVWSSDARKRRGSR